MTKDMTKGSPMKLILGFSIPLFFGFLEPFHLFTVGLNACFGCPIQKALPFANKFNPIS